jgi:hypothetical protein
MPLIKEERDAAEARVPDSTSQPPHDHGDFLFMEIKQQISCRISVIMSQAAEFPRSAPPRAAGNWANRANGTAKTGRDRFQRHCTRRELYR